MSRKNIYKVGVTGGIGSGKSTVCALLAEYGVPVYDSDAQAKRLMNESEALREALVQCFSAECYNEQGLNREYLSRKVFGNDEALSQLNAIVHPAVREDFRARAKAQNANDVVL